MHNLQVRILLEQKRAIELSNIFDNETDQEKKVEIGIALLEASTRSSRLLRKYIRLQSEQLNK